MRNALRAWIVPALLLGVMAYAIAEEITLTTYYPSPRGVYDQLRTAGNVQLGSVEPPLETVPATPTPRLHVIQGSAGTEPAFRVDDEAPTPTSYDPTPFIIDSSGNVGIGTAPTADKLTVAGTINAQRGEFAQLHSTGPITATASNVTYTGLTTTLLVSDSCSAACDASGTRTQTYDRWVQGLYVERYTVKGACDGPACPSPPTTPFLAGWNGRQYLVDNDILHGYPSSYRPTYPEAKRMYENGVQYLSLAKDGLSLFGLSRVAYDRGDLYALQQPTVPKNGRNAFLILERDHEESFFDELKLLKVVHEPAQTILVSNDLHTLSARALDRPIHYPSLCKTHDGQDCTEQLKTPHSNVGVLLLQKDAYIDLTFPYRQWTTAPQLLLRSRHRQQTPQAVFQAPPNLPSPAPGRPPSWWLPVISPWVGAVTAMERMIPYAYAQETGCSLRVLYQGERGTWRLAAVVHPRNRWTTELVQIPPAALRAFDRRKAVHVRLVWTATHALEMAGLVEGVTGPFTVEPLTPVRAYHHRLKADYAQQLAKKDFDYLHTIQGDVVEVEFGTGTPVPEGKTATLVIASEGFYTDLRAYLYPNVDFTYYKQFWNEPPDSR